MSFQQKDLKILWGKAAGRCSMPDCRKQLVTEASEAVPSKAILLGENCHIVAEKEGGARGGSDLNKEDRNRYPNLILLCTIHHRMIDQDPNNWSIEKLHQIKADHEIWVETQLTISTDEDEETLYYTKVVNKITEYLLLEYWNWVSGNAFRCILVAEFAQGIEKVCEMSDRAIWLDGYDKLRDAIINLSKRLSTLLEHFMTLAHPIYDGEKLSHFREDRSWKQVWQKDYDKYAERSNTWEEKYINLFTNVVVALNEYSQAVRSSLNSRYFLYEGKFTLIDDCGITTDGFTPAYYIPEQYTQISAGTN